jgi:hypothetical protein
MTHLKKPEPVEISWRVIEGSTTRILTCAIFAASDESVELRVGLLRRSAPAFTNDA